MEKTIEAISSVAQATVDGYSVAKEQYNLFMQGVKPLDGYSIEDLNYAEVSF